MHISFNLRSWEITTLMPGISAGMPCLKPQLGPTQAFQKAGMWWNRFLLDWLNCFSHLKSNKSLYRFLAHLTGNGPSWEHLHGLWELRHSLWKERHNSRPRTRGSSSSGAGVSTLLTPSSSGFYLIFFPQNLQIPRWDSLVLKMEGHLTKTYISSGPSLISNKCSK